MCVKILEKGNWMTEISASSALDRAYDRLDETFRKKHPEAAVGSNHGRVFTRSDLIRPVVPSRQPVWKRDDYYNYNTPPACHPKY
jgi:hypothetical protein